MYEESPMHELRWDRWTYTRTIDGFPTECGPSSVLQLQDLLDQ